MNIYLLSIFLFVLGCSHAPPVSGPLLNVGQNFPIFTLNDQFDKEVALTSNTSWVLFSKEKDVNAMVHGVLQSHKDFVSQGGLYVVNISAMPSLVTKLFAMPKMRKYPYSMALDTEGTTTNTWPVQTGAATLFKLKGGRIEEIVYIKTAEELTALF